MSIIKQILNDCERICFFMSAIQQTKVISSHLKKKKKIQTKTTLCIFLQRELDEKKMILAVTDAAYGKYETSTSSHSH